MMAMAWLKNYANVCGDQMPDSPKIHLPSCSTKASVYKLMKEEIEEADGEICSETHFKRAWREELSYITIPQVNRFARCDTCSKLKSQLEACSNKKERCHLQQARELHLKQQRTEREKYYKHITKARRHPQKYMSIIIDGMDQKTTAVPHFVRDSKTSNGAWKLLTHVTGAIVHGRGQHCYVDVNEVPHDSNLSIMVLLLILQRYADQLPKVLYLQMDNCGRENKNKYVFAFLCLLVELEVFEKVKVSFLMVGHTHEDIDQMFSRISTRINRLNIYTLDDLIKQVPLAFQKANTTAERLSGVYNTRDWLSPAIEPIHRHSKPHCFKIVKGAEGKARISSKLWSTSPEWETPTGTPCLLTHLPDGQPEPVRPDFTSVDLRRLTRQMERLGPFLPDMSKRQWSDLLEELGRAESGEAEMNVRWPLADILMHPTDNALQLQMSGSSSTSCESEEPVPCRVHIGRKVTSRDAIVKAGDMVATYLQQYPREWPQVGQVINKKEGHLELQWFTGTTTSQWKPLTLSMPGVRGERQPWRETIMESAVITTPFTLTRSGRLPGDVQVELKELRDRYIV